MFDAVCSHRSDDTILTRPAIKFDVSSTSDLLHTNLPYHRLCFMISYFSYYLGSAVIASGRHYSPSSSEPETYSSVRLRRPTLTVTWITLITAGSWQTGKLTLIYFLFRCVLWSTLDLRQLVNQSVKRKSVARNVDDLWITEVKSSEI